MSTYYTVGDALYPLNFSRDTLLKTLSWNATAQNFLYFNGSSFFVSCGNDVSLDVTQPITIEAKVMPSSLAGRFGIYTTRSGSAAGSYQLEVGTGNGGTNRVAVTTPAVWDLETENDVITTNVWQHIVFTKSPQKLYVNGDLQTLVTDNPQTFQNNTDLKEIGRGTGGTQYFDGLIDRVRLWDRALSPEEVEDCYNGNAPRNGLVAEWLMNEGSGDTTYDTSVNSNDGTLNGALWRNTKVKFQIKAGDNWYGSSGIDTYFTSSPSSLSGVPVGAQFYIKSILTTTNVTVTPILHDFTVVFLGGAGYDYTSYALSACPRCLGKGFYWDVNLDDGTGKLETIKEESKLHQDLEKIVLEINNKFHSERGNVFKDIDSVSLVYLKKRILQEIVRNIQRLKILQEQAEEKGFSLPKRELIRKVNKIDVDDTPDPRKFIVTIDITTKNYTKVDYRNVVII